MSKLEQIEVRDSYNNKYLIKENPNGQGLLIVKDREDGRDKINVSKYGNKQNALIIG